MILNKFYGIYQYLVFRESAIQGGVGGLPVILHRVYSHCCRINWTFLLIPDSPAKSGFTFQTTPVTLTKISLFFAIIVMLLLL